MFKVAGAITEIISGRNVNGLIDALKSDNPLSKFKEQKEFEDKMKEFFLDALTEKGNRLIVFIDELDRCKPSYAVQLLEQIKHYLFDDRVTFVFSINMYELQHTIRHYYGSAFDASRYLNRFFDLNITLPPVDIVAYYQSISGNTVTDYLNKAIIKHYNMELRDISRLYQQEKIAIQKVLNDGIAYSFPDEKGKSFLLNFFVPILISMKIVDINEFDDFISGKNGALFVDIIHSIEDAEWIMMGMLNANESFENEEGKTKVMLENKVLEVYRAVFENDYSGRRYSVNVGKYQFNAESKKFVLAVASALSEYAEHK